MSAPAQNARPAPVMTMAPISGSALHRAMASRYSDIMRGVHALSFSGRLKVMTPTRPFCSNAICS